MYLRCVDVAPFIELESVCIDTDEKYSIQVDLIDILGRIDDITVQKDLHINQGNEQITLTIPRNFYNETIYDAYINSIRCVKCGDKTIDVRLFDVNDDKTMLLESLPASIFDEYKNYVLKQDAIVADFHTFETRASLKDDAPLIPYKLSVLNSSMRTFLKFLFEDNLKSLFEFEFYILSKVHLPYEILTNCTLVELQIYTGCTLKSESPSKKSNNAPQVGKPLETGALL